MPGTKTEIERLLADLADTDPRLDPEYVRVTAGAAGVPVVVVGVVHDHPSSEHRVRTLVDGLDPAVVALELPDVLVGVDVPTGVTGGEMAAASETAGDAALVGIDAPNPGALLTLAVELHERDASPRTRYEALRGASRMVHRTVLERLAAVPHLAGLLDVQGGARANYDCSPADPPAAQAAHERDHVRSSRALRSLLDPPAATRVLDAARERYMAGRLAALSAHGAVVAVVGASHLDTVADGVAANVGSSEKQRGSVDRPPTA